jgi:multiple sugar transport system substrate-binding protein
MAMGRWSPVRRAWVGLIAVLLVLAACTGGKGTSGSATSQGVAEVVLWHPYESGVERKALEDLVEEWNQTHYTIRATARYYGNSDAGLERVQAAIRSGSYPDAAYLYGSSLADIATDSKTLVLDKLVAGNPGMVWEDFWPAARQAMTVDRRIVGIPALVDNLAVVYNEKLFDRAGLGHPTPRWTWDDFRAAAKALTDRAAGRYGFTFPVGSGETTVWQWEALLWEAGGDILTRDGGRAAFASPAGVRATRLLRDMAVVDRSVYLDPTAAKMEELFDAGKIAMIVTGPWDLASFPHVDYGVQIMPTFGDQSNHQTISGPDAWVLFDNGPTRSRAAFQFVSWLTATQQDMTYALATGHLPLRVSETRLGEFKQYAAKTSGIATFVENEKNAVKARPTTPLYPKISVAIEGAVSSVLLDGVDVRTALDRAAKRADGIIAAGG